MSLNCSLSGMSANSTSRRCMLRCKELLAVAVHVYRYNHFWTYTLSLPTLSLIGAVSQESSWCMLLDLVTLSPHENDERLKSKVQNYFCVIITGNIRWGGNVPPYTWPASCRPGTSSIWVIRSHKCVCVEEKVCFITYLSAWQCIKNWIRVDHSVWLISTALSCAYIYTGCKHTCQSLK